MSSTRMTVVLGWACLVTGIGCRTSPAPVPDDSLRQASEMASAAAPERVLAESDPIRQKLIKMIPGAHGLLQPATRTTKSELLKALQLGSEKGFRGVKIGEALCDDRVGCRVDVWYDTREDFLQFDREKFHNPGKGFEAWGGPSGRTGLLSEPGRKFVATWFFLNKHEKCTYENNPARRCYP